MLPRFLAPDLRVDREFELPPEEARHAARVLRLGVDAEVLAFDGRGRQVRARIVSTSRATVRLAPVATAEAAAEPRVPITLAQAVLKSDAMDDVVRDATMMGAAALVPLVSRRSVVSVQALRRRKADERWYRVAVASAKQSGRAVVPTIHPPAAVDDWLGRLPPEGATRRLILAEPALHSDAVPARRRLLDDESARTPPDAVLAVGPEGGWEAAELRLAENVGFEVVRLGGRTLRADAVAVAAIAVLQFAWSDL